MDTAEGRISQKKHLDIFVRLFVVRHDCCVNTFVMPLLSLLCMLCLTSEGCMILNQAKYYFVVLNTVNLSFNFIKFVRGSTCKLVVNFLLRCCLFLLFISPI